MADNGYPVVVAQAGVGAAPPADAAAPAAEAKGPSVEDMLDRVQITPEHIRSNGTIHESPFSGIAELTDNAVDSGANTVKILNGYSDHNYDGTEEVEIRRYISVIDNGEGMDREEALKTILIGHSLKRGDVGTIGQFGNGLKSGSMRVGNTMLLCTKKDNEFTVLMISLPYLDTVPGEKCLVPCISYKVESSHAWVPSRTATEIEAKHAAALDLILRYSPFDTEEKLQEYLKFYIMRKGTMVVISELRRLENNEFELQFDRLDFVVKKRAKPEGPHPCLSEYLQQLYLKPKIAIMIGDKDRQRQVRLLDPLRSCAFPRWVYLSKEGMSQFREREQEMVNKELAKLTAQKVSLAQQESRLLSEISFTKPKDMKEMTTKLRRKQMELEAVKKQCEALEKRNVGKDKPGADIRVYFGIDVARRCNARAVFYSSGRRIMTKFFGAKHFKSVMGVVSIVDIPSTLLPTAQHREKFEIQSEFDVIWKKIEKHAKTYFAHADVKFKSHPFWHSLGYEDKEKLELDVADTSFPEVRRKLHDLTGRGRQCVNCREFKAVPWHDALQLSLEDTVYACGDALHCVEKTQEEIDAEMIKELDTSVKATSYDEEDARVRMLAEPRLLRAQKTVHYPISSSSSTEAARKRKVVSRAVSRASSPKVTKRKVEKNQTQKKPQGPPAGKRATRSSSNARKAAVQEGSSDEEEEEVEEVRPARLRPSIFDSSDEEDGEEQQSEDEVAVVKQLPGHNGSDVTRDGRGASSSSQQLQKSALEQFKIPRKQPVVKSESNDSLFLDSPSHSRAPSSIATSTTAAAKFPALFSNAAPAMKGAENRRRKSDEMIVIESKKRKEDPATKPRGGDVMNVMGQNSTRDVDAEKDGRNERMTSGRRASDVMIEGNYERGFDDALEDISDDDEVALVNDGQPRKRMMNRDEREAGLMDKSEEDLRKNILHLQEQMNQKDKMMAAKDEELKSMRLEMEKDKEIKRKTGQNLKKFAGMQIAEEILEVLRAIRTARDPLEVLDRYMQPRGGAAGARADIALD